MSAVGFWDLRNETSTESIIILLKQNQTKPNQAKIVPHRYSVYFFINNRYLFLHIKLLDKCFTTNEISFLSTEMSTIFDINFYFRKMRPRGSK